MESVKDIVNVLTDRRIKNFKEKEVVLRKALAKADWQTVIILSKILSETFNHIQQQKVI